MLAKILVIALAVAVVSCQEKPYNLKKLFQQEQAKEYKHRPYDHIHPSFPLKSFQEPAPISEEQYQEAQASPAEQAYEKPQESYPPAYSSQSIIHHAASGQQDSQENSGERGIYQYVQEQNEDVKVRQPTTHKYQGVHYPVHYPAPVQHEAPAAKPVYKPQAHYTRPQEGFSFHRGVHLEQAPVYQQTEGHAHESHDEPIDYYAYPKYQYEYKVEDPHTGDNKFQHEIRDGDVVKGVYGLHEADGSVRTVEYSSDKHKGFSAIVKHSAPGQHVHIESHHDN
ncbi:uncharacterized protein LOC114243030 [Bombyx mandarina]|uniref:Uncharacterized protein LOC114243030 n=1 Tax=Bombyx mandarina TaxID=7092 RepID=A0A6J2JKZ1_BOMMA|nr:uncharacterized protein LOC114243030 [Bombyx mandarina]